MVKQGWPAGAVDLLQSSRLQQKGVICGIYDLTEWLEVIPINKKGSSAHEVQHVDSELTGRVFSNENK